MFKSNKTYLFDGGSGQTLLEKGLVPEGTLWSATALINKNLHKLVIDMHLDFINAGSEIIVTSNFSVRKRRLIEHNKIKYFQSATYYAGTLANKAKEIANKKIVIAGSLPTQGDVYVSKSFVNNKEIFNGFKETATILDPFVNLFYLDVLCSIKEIQIACEAINNFKKPILIGVHLNKNGKLPSGENINDIMPIIKNFNCCGILTACVAPEIVELAIPFLRKQKLPFGFKVNAFDEIPEDGSYQKNYAGYPTDIFGKRKNFTTEYFKSFVKKNIDNGATLIGGCCEIKPRHIKAINELI